MDNIFKIARHEIKLYFITPIGYIVLSLFSVLAGWFFFHHVNQFNDLVTHFQMSQQPDVLNQINLNRFVLARLFQELLMLMNVFIPALTMRLIAEEKKQKTIELLMTSPLETYEIILGKFFSVMVFVGLMLGITFIYPVILYIFGRPGPELVTIITGYIGLLLVSSCIASVGLFASAITENQIIAFIIALFISNLFYVISLPAPQIAGPAGELLRFLSLRDNFNSLARAFIDTRVIIYYISFTFIWLFLTHRAIEGTRIR